MTIGISSLWNMNGSCASHSRVNCGQAKRAIMASRSRCSAMSKTYKPNPMVPGDGHSVFSTVAPDVLNSTDIRVSHPSWL